MQETAIHFKKLIMKKLKLTTLFILIVFNINFAQNMNINNSDYADVWKAVQSLEEQGLPKSAREKVDSLYIVAKSDNNPSQVIKTLIYRSKYITELEDDGFTKAVGQLQDEANREKFPIKPILQSMLGELYANYLENNVWRFRNRTTTIDFKQDDIRTWDIEKLNTEAARLFRESLADKQTLDIAISNFNAITTENVGEELRPTLYDFLVHRAIDFFMDEKSYLTKPAYKFELDTEGVFDAAENFVGILFDSKDSTSNKLWALKIMQDVIRLHLKDTDPAALIDVDLKRLDFVKNNSVLDNKDDLYVKSLEFLQRKYVNQPAFVEISLKLAQHYFEKAQQYKRNPENIGKNDYKIALELAKTAIQRFPKAYGVQACRTLVHTISEPSLSVQVEQVNVPNKAILASIKYKNVESVYFKVIKINDNLLERNFESDNERLNAVNSRPFVKTWSVKVLNEGDYHFLTTEDKIDKLPLGNYILIASDNERFQLKEGGKVNMTHFFVSNLSFMQRTEEGAKEFIVVDRTSGAPLKGVKVEFWLSQYNSQKRKDEKIKASTAVTDIKGIIRPKLEANQYYTTKFIFGKDTLAIGEGFSYYNFLSTPQKYQFTEFFLDRAIYRPGQTVFFKAILLEKSEKGMPKIIPNRVTTITFYDVNRQKISELVLTSNEYGTLNGSFVAPSSGLLGTMHIESDMTGSKYFSIEEYKRPKFEVKIMPLEGTFTLNQEVKVKGNAKSFAGSNVDGAKVTYRITRQVDFPYWKDWFWRPWSTETPQEIAHGEVMSDTKGEFTIPFKALPNKTIPAKQKPVFEYNIQVDVTDITGETHSTSTSVKVGYTSLSLSAEIPDLMNRRKIMPIKINTNNLNGQPLKTQVTVKIDLLTSPKRPFVKRYWEIPDTHQMDKATFNRFFPLYPYKNEDDMPNWAIKRKMYNGKTTTVAPLSKEGNLLNIPDMSNWEPGAYRVTLNATDESGENIEVIEHFTLYDLDDKLVPINKTLFTVFEKNTLEPNENAIFYTGTSDESLNVLFEIERDGKIDTQNWMDVKGFQKMLFKIMETDRGNIHYHLTYVKNNRFQSETQTVVVPFSNKELNIEYQTFRDKLLPGQDEEWRLKITGKNKDKVAAEMVVAMYDASLDQFVPNSWSLDLYSSSSARRNLNASSFKAVNSEDFYQVTEGMSDNPEIRTYRAFNWFGFSFYEGRSGGFVLLRRSVAPMAMDAAEPASYARKEISDSLSEKAAAVVVNAMPAPPPPPTDGSPKDKTYSEKKPNDISPVKVRTNLNETVFFYPNLMTDNEGNIIIKFKMNEALTRWKFLSLAHTKDLKVGLSQKVIITQKDLMVFPNAPRFFREDDAIEFTAKVSNLSVNTAKGSAVLQLFDALTNQPIDVLLDNKQFEVPFEAKAGESALLTWKLKIPTGKVQAVTYRVIARAGSFSDGEENTLPVLTNRMLVTESLPLSVRGGETKKFEFKSLKEASSSTLTHQKMTLEFTQNPAWYAVQALPYLMEYPYECTEQIFSRYYANSLASNVANANPKIKSVFDRWKSIDITALQSNLSKNQELKTALLEETPWVLDAQREEVQKKNIGLLFDLNKMANEAETATKKMQERQLDNGGFAWFPGGRDNWYITQYMTEGFGHLDALGVKSFADDGKTKLMVYKAILYCDERVKEYYAEIEKQVNLNKGKMEDDHLSNIVIHYLYTRSFFKNDDVLKGSIFSYFVNQAEKYWLNKSIYEQGLIALALKRFDKGITTDKIVKSLKERAINNEELGMYWKAESGYYWYQMPIETHSLMIELFNEIGDPKAVDDLKVWLLKNKQTNAWKTTKATSSAVYALLKTGSDWLAEHKDIAITIDDKLLDVNKMDKEAGTGYFKTTFKADDITTGMGDVVVTNPNTVVAWGAMYWQYFENLDKIKSFKDTPLKMVKQLFKEVNADKGKVISLITDKTPLNPGDKIKVRIELRVERDMEYVHMKDMRASSFEPTNVLSGYKWQGGLGYYESTRDASTNFFFDYLPKGTYVFEYPLVINHKGNFSNGITTIQCMYAPEFTSHTEGVRVQVGGN